jgi:hypothetical protein
MSVPLDRLYNYIENIATEATDNVIIYRFFPHGSKKITDLTQYRPYDLQQAVLSPEIICHDQEPLNFESYEGITDLRWFTIQVKACGLDYTGYDNFRELKNTYGIYDKAIVIHSEKRSNNVEKYKNSYFILAYYWSHAIIALDWFRYAEHVQQQKQVTHTFLIYNRAWSGTREYRLRFAELLVHQNLKDYCKMSISPIEPELGIHYETHKFDNPLWQPSTVLETYFPINTAPSYYSADFDITDYESTDIEVVLETLFDDERLHLTEKSLRPIACAQPFILAGTHGSLEYLRSYGFKTFADVWDEGYDTIEDPQLRMCAIVDLMNQIANWGPTQEKKMAHARDIAEYNQQHFFSKDFWDQVTGELKTNLAQALLELENTNTSQRYLDRRKLLSKVDFLKKFLTGDQIPLDATDPTVFTRKNIARQVAQARKYYNQSLK